MYNKVMIIKIEYMLSNKELTSLCVKHAHKITYFLYHFPQLEEQMAVALEEERHLCVE